MHTSRQINNIYYMLNKFKMIMKVYTVSNLIHGL